MDFFIISLDKCFFFIMHYLKKLYIFKIFYLLEVFLLKCYNHPQRDAIAQCSDCGKGLCEECATKWKPPTCYDCMKNYVNNEMSSVNGELIIYIILAIIGAVFGGTMGMGHGPMAKSSADALFLIIIYALSFPMYLAGWRWLNKITDYFVFLGTIQFWIIYIAIKLVCSAMVGLFALPYRLFIIFKRRRELKALLEN